MPTMISPLRRAVQVAADRPAVVCGHARLTYAEMWDRCRRLLGALRALGLEEGDRVGVVSANCHRYLELYQGVPGAGASKNRLNERFAVRSAPRSRTALMATMATPMDMTPTLITVPTEKIVCLRADAAAWPA